jgi:tetratricopeptide (TPR) repeat protein
VQTSRVSLFVCLALATALGTWYLGVRVPDNQWREADVAGQNFMVQRHYSEAERQFTLAVYAARVFGDEDPRRARSLFHLAETLVARARHAEAIPLLEQALAINQKALGPEHPEVTRAKEYRAAVLRQAQTDLVP